jgi:predicted porin
MNPSNPTSDLAQTSIFGYGIAHASVTPFTGTPNEILNVYWIGGNYDFTPAWRFSLGYYHVNQNDYSGGSAATSALGKLAGNDDYYSGMLEYKLSKRTNLYGALLHNNKTGGVANAVNGAAIGVSTGVTSYTALGIGVRHVF